MKKLIPFLFIVIIVSGCSVSDLKANFFSAKKETEEAINNLTEEAIETKELIETKTNQVKNTAESISDAAEALNQAAEDIKTLTGGEVNE